MRFSICMPSCLRRLAKARSPFARLTQPGGLQALDFGPNASDERINVKYTKLC